MPSVPSFAWCEEGRRCVRPGHGHAALFLPTLRPGQEVILLPLSEDQGESPGFGLWGRASRAFWKCRRRARLQWSQWSGWGASEEFLPSAPLRGRSSRKTVHLPFGSIQCHLRSSHWDSQTNKHFQVVPERITMPAMALPSDGAFLAFAAPPPSPQSHTVWGLLCRPRKIGRSQQ